MVTYGASGKDLNSKMFEEGGIHIDECYTALDHAVKFTLIHLKKKKRISSIRKFMEFASQKYGIIYQEIFGYNGVSSDDGENQLHDHPGIRIILEIWIT